MTKTFQNDPNLVKDVAKKTDKIEQAYLAKQAKKRQRKIEKEELSQRWVAPLLLILTILLGFLVSLIFNR